MKKIGISLNFQDTWDKEVTRGIIEKAKEYKEWHLSGPIGGLRDMFNNKEDQLDALITRIETPESLKRYRKLGIPIVDVAGSFYADGIYRVHNDDRATGKKAGLCVRDLGHPSFAYCGVKDAMWSQERSQGFCDALGVELQDIELFNRSLKFYKNPERSKELTTFLIRLETPTAIFCCNDIAALKVTQHLIAIGYTIPKDVSVVSVDNDPLLCSLAHPSLTSIALDCFNIGQIAASTLFALLDKGDENYPIETLVAPLEVVERESTQIFLTDDKQVHDALIYIRERAGDGINVEDVVQMSKTSRRNLEMKWRVCRGKTILSEIIASRLKVAKRLLRESDATIETVASESGFHTSQRFYAHFKRQEGISPGQYRINMKKSY